MLIGIKDKGLTWADLITGSGAIARAEFQLTANVKD